MGEELDNILDERADLYAELEDLTEKIAEVKDEISKVPKTVTVEIDSDVEDALDQEQDIREQLEDLMKSRDERKAEFAKLALSFKNINKQIKEFEKPVYSPDGYECDKFYENPPGYDSVKCDECSNRYLQENPKGFYHCEKSDYDICI